MVYGQLEMTLTRSVIFSVSWLYLDNLDNHTNNPHKAGTTTTPTTGGNFRRACNGVPTPSSLPSSSSIPQPPLLPHHTPVVLPPPTPGIFPGIHSRSGDLVDRLSRSGSFSVLHNLFDTECLFELRDFRITSAMPKDEDIEQFTTSMWLVLDLT